MDHMEMSKNSNFSNSIKKSLVELEEASNDYIATTLFSVKQMLSDLSQRLNLPASHHKVDYQPSQKFKLILLILKEMMSYIQGHPYASSFGYSWILEMEMILISRRHKYCLLGRLSHEVGWNYYDTIKWTFHPFIFQSKKIYTVLLWRRVLAFLCISASITFL